MLRWTMVLAYCVAFCESGLAQEKKQPELLPPPRPIMEQLMPYYLPNSLPNPATREIWQYFAVDRSGRFRPRVVYSDLGSFYLYGGREFPWTTTQPQLFMPYALD
ncbi:MAG: hypothetical protein L0Y72_16495 [Gemmataceae bacterium]|nr:hypothetical protein [Gemmataceae bacterium]MCI0740649.1 hypothetical protein [Gemmataceae bacterium]